MQHTASLKLIETVFESEHLPPLFAGQDTNQPTLKLIAQILPYTQDEDFISDIFLAAVPSDYKGDTLKEIPTMIKGGLDKGFDKNEIIEGETQAKALISLAKNSGAVFFHDEHQRAYVELPIKDKKLVCQVKSSHMKRWLQLQFFETMGGTAQPTAITA